MAEAFGMTEEHRKILRKHHSILEENLQPLQLLKYLREILSDDDCENVEAERTRAGQSSVLLGILPKKGPKAFVCFVNALWKVQRHLAHSLSESAGLEEPSDIDENEKVVLSKELKTKLKDPRLRTLLKEDLNKIIKLMRITFNEEDLESINSKASAYEKVDEFLSILPLKGLAAYKHFVDVTETVKPKIANILKDTSSQADQNQKKTLTNHPVNETPISNIKDYLQTFCAVTDECNGWLKLAQEYELRQEKYMGIQNPTGAVLNDWIEKEGDMANVSKLLQTLDKYDLDQSRASLNELLSSRDHTYSPKNTLVKKVECLSLAPFPVKETGVVARQETLQDLDPKTLKDLRIRATQEANDKHISIDSFERSSQLKIRDLTKELRKHNLTESIMWMKSNLFAGMTGPLLDENTYVRDLPFKTRSKLTIELTTDQKWKPMAEELGMDQAKIRYFEQQYKNPADEVLKDWQTKAISKVGYLYDLLVRLDLPISADIL